MRILPWTTLSIVALAIALAAGPVRAQSGGAAAAPGAGVVSGLAGARMVTLSNGLRVLLDPDPAATGLDVTIWFDAGGRTEPPGRSGITHLVERLMSRTPDAQARAAELETHGGVTSTFTTPDLTGFSVTGPPSILETALALHAARMAEPQPTSEVLAAEREAIHEERPRRPESSPNGRAVRRLFELLEPTLSYRASLTGSDEDLARLTARDCSDYFRARFGPSAALLTVVGRFDPDLAQKQLAATVGRVPRHGEAASKLAPRRPTPVAGPVRETSDFQLPILFVGWRAPAASSADAAALDLLSRLLTTGVSARLAGALMNPQQGGVFVQGGYDGRRDGGVFYAAVATSPGVDGVKIERALIAEVEKLAAEPVETAELERARRQAESNLLFGWQASWSRAQALGTAQMVNGDWRAAWDRLDQYRKTTPEQIERAAAAVLKPEGRAIVWLAPATPAGGVR